VLVEMGKGVWALEQEQGIGLGLGVSNIIRSTVVRLRSGGLWVHNPVAPTAECVRLLGSLGGAVEHIVLGTTLYEHKVYLGPFTRRFPQAAVYVAPRQFSWPLDLPLPLLGVRGAVTLEQGGRYPWSRDLAHDVFSPRSVVVEAYKYSEVAFFHRSSRSLLVTDAVIFVDEEVPEVLEDSLIENAADNENFLIRTLAWLNYQGNFRERKRELEAMPEPSPAKKSLRGWQRIVLFSLFISPDGKNVLDPRESFRKVSGRWIVGPVVYALVYQNIPAELAEWVDRVARWPFQRIVAGHFASPRPGTGRDLRRAFEWTAALGQGQGERAGAAAATEGTGWFKAPPPWRFLPSLQGAQEYDRSEVPEGDMKALSSVGRIFRRVDEFVYGDK
jgi:hypothetical protein